MEAPTTPLYGLIGRSLGHSFSARYFAERFAAGGICAEYRNFPLRRIEELPELLRRHPTLRGFNVTIPYKELVMPLLDALTPVARATGAVNAVRVVRTGDRILLFGHNTDVEGFGESLDRMLGSDRPEKGLILGSGGASKAVAHALRLRGMESTVVSRTPGRADLTYADIDASVISGHRLVVNATPVGTAPDPESAPPLPYHLLTGRHYCHDLVYNPSTTLFMRLSRQEGARVKNGADMLRRQADAAWAFWQTTDNPPFS